MLKFISSIFGNKHERDTKLLQPVVEEVNNAYEHIKTLSNDDLRGKTGVFRKQIHELILADENRIAELKAQAELTESIEEKEKLYAETDQLQKKIYQDISRKLDEILPEAFAVVKETAKRFKENKTLVVTATDHDRNLAAKKEYITIEGDNAVYQNNWIAGGNRITWDMVHYDVQLMGGGVTAPGENFGDGYR